jgi:hypothetical protein
MNVIPEFGPAYGYRYLEEHGVQPVLNLRPSAKIWSTAAALNLPICVVVSHQRIIISCGSHVYAFDLLEWKCLYAR